MESESQRTAASSHSESASHQLESGEGPLGRLQDHAKGLSEDVRAWLEMRFELAKIEFWERVDERADELVLYAIVGGLSAVGGFVMLLATCLGASWIISALTGWTLGALFLGFLVVAILFFTVAGLVFAANPRFGLFKEKTRATLSEKQVMEGRAAGERVAPEGASNE